MGAMPKKAKFDAIVNANNMVTIPEATRQRLQIVPGKNVKVTIEIEA
jgi:bifunctional DNA-binding transcriptional regulator/antitoxin component of YhaV-PrlF toxin-antitoxin module